MVDPRRQTRWQSLRRRARLRLGLWAAAVAGVPALLVVWTLAGALVAANRLPALAAGVLGVIAGAAAALALFVWRRRKLAATRLSDPAVAALDWRLGVGPDDERPTAFWRGQSRHATGDPWYSQLILATIFAVGLNSVGLWLGPAGALVGVPYTEEIASDIALVRLDRITVTAPQSGEVTEYGASDGYLQVEEGAKIRWQVEPVKPATTITMALAGGPVYRQPVTGPTAVFSHTVTEPTSYRFALHRWGVVRREARPRRLGVLPDLPPEIRWRQRPPEEPAADQLIEFAWRASDDRAVTATALELAGEEERVVLPLYQGPATPDTGQRKGVLDPSELPAGDRVTLTLLAVDNDRYEGPNVGRSDPAVIRFRSVEERHEDWRDSLTSLLTAEVRLLGDTIEARPHAGRWKREAESRAREARNLAERARRLADESQQLPLSSIDAFDTLLAVAEEWVAYANGPLREKTELHAEDAVWQTDELLGREDAARIEYEQDQLINRLDQLAENIEDLNDAELNRMLRMLDKEMRDLHEAMQQKRPQLPTELVQKDALKPEEASEQQSLMQEIREALEQGDRKRAKELMEQLLEQMRKARESMAEGAGEWMDQELPDLDQLDQRKREIQELQREQERVSEQLEAADRQQHQLEERMQQELEQGGQRGARQEAAAGGMRDAMAEGDADGLEQAMQKLPGAAQSRLEPLAQAYRQQRGAQRKLAAEQERLRERLDQVQQQIESGKIGSGALRQALSEADEHMEGAAQAAGKGQPGPGANAGWQAADSLERAAKAVDQLQQQAQTMRQQPGYRRPGGEQGQARRDGADGRMQQEPFEAPEPGADGEASREEILQGFRTGLPDAGRDVNERYLDRLLH